MDYVLTIAISLANGGDALFSVLPATWLPWKLVFGCAGIAVLALLNLRGVGESVMLFVPVNFVFVGTQAVANLIATIDRCEIRQRS